MLDTLGKSLLGTTTRPGVAALGEPMVETLGDATLETPGLDTHSSKPWPDRLRWTSLRGTLGEQPGGKPLGSPRLGPLLWYSLDEFPCFGPARWPLVWDTLRETL